MEKLAAIIELLWNRESEMIPGVEGWKQLEIEATCPFSGNDTPNY